MSEPLYWVIVRSKMKGRKLRRRRHSIVRRMGPMSYSEAQATKEATSVNLGRNRDDFTVQMNVDRTDYWARYHRRRYKTDKKYRASKRKSAREWQRNARAAAKGDVTPWLTLD